MTIRTTLHFAFRGDRLLVVRRGDRFDAVEGATLPLSLDVDVSVPVQVPAPDGRTVVVHDLPDDVDAPDGLELVGLRALGTSWPESLFHVAGAALQKVEWIRSHRFCARCGTPTRRHDRHEALTCPACGQLHFPRLAPAVIVLVQRGHEMLLARSPRFAEGVYSTLAGFVEPGESLEEAVHREIAEEVGVRVTNLRYFGSQPWPFPHSLMVGFVADWAGGEIRPDPEEIEDARWFSAERMPPHLPYPLSIARRLVDDFLVRTSRETT